MRDTVDHILLQDSWTDQDRRTLLQAGSQDPELCDLISSWMVATGRVRDTVVKAFPDPEMLVLFALSRSNHADLLSSAESDELGRSEADLNEALRKYPSIELILERIQADAETFESEWSMAASEPRAGDRPPSLLRRVSLPRVRLITGIAAALAITVFALVLTRQASDSRPFEQIRTTEHEMRIVNLADGSTVRVMQNSNLTYLADPDAFDRHVVLSGKAFFEVNPDDVAFRVETANSVTTVLGTSFGVVFEDNVTEVTLVTGRVSLAASEHSEDPVLLEPGMASSISGSGVPTDPYAVNLDEALIWTRLFIFRDTPLRHIATRLSDSFKVTITLEEGLEDEVLTGTFSEDQGVDEILDVISSALGIRVEVDVESGSYRLLSKI